MSRQDRADAVDREMAARPLPEAALQALGRWWTENATRCADGTPGAHTVRYTPSRWAEITPWPTALAPVADSGGAAVSRADVASIVADALRREAFREALVATYVWGKGKRGSPKGSGPTTLGLILSAEGLDRTLARSVSALNEHGARAAYEELNGRIPWFGAAFFTKFLYFAGKTVRPASGPEPLVLDRFLARRLRSLAEAVGRETGHDPDGSVAAWVWSDGGWSPHRYAVYLSFMHEAARQLAKTGRWPSGAAPDLLEYALFSTAWERGAVASGTARCCDPDHTRSWGGGASRPHG